MSPTIPVPGPRRLPNFIVIGAAKAGTTALYWYLDEHPEIYRSPLKETNFIAYETNESGAPVYGDPELHHFPITSIEQYLDLFGEAGYASAVGEASPIYLEATGTAERIAATIPEAKIICGLRNPIDRAYSDYQMYLRSRGETLDPSVDLTVDARWLQPESHWMLIGRYHAMLTPYFEVFPRSRIHIYLFDELRTESLRVVQEVYRFLAVDDTYEPDLKTPHNVGGIPAVMGVERLLTSKRLRAIVEPLVPRGAVDVIRRMRTANLRPAPPLPPEARALMTENIRDDVRRTQELIGVDLGHWLQPQN